MKLIIFGPQGSGKGTYASRLGPILKVPHISTGDMIRAEIANKTEIGKNVELMISQGKLAPDEVVNKLLEDRLKKEDAKNGFILDGYPRNLPQAQILDKVTKIDAVINLVVPETVLIQRLSTRIICRRCGTIFNTLTLKPRVEGICDKCGGELYQRDDDKPEAIKQRLKFYREQSEPLISFYRKKGIVLDIPCDRADIPPEIIVEKILNALKFKK